MKKFRNLLLIFSVAIFSAACSENTELPEQTGIISGTLTPGEKLTLTDLKGAILVLSKLKYWIDPSSVTTKTKEIEVVDTAWVASDGSFSFKGLEFGNYVLFFEDRFLFHRDTFAIITFDGKEEYQFNVVDRYPKGDYYDTRKGNYFLKVLNNARIDNYTLRFYSDWELFYEVDGKNDTQWRTSFKYYIASCKNLYIRLKFTDSSGEVLSANLNYPGIFTEKSKCKVTVNGRTLHLSTYWLFGEIINIED